MVSISCWPHAFLFCLMMYDVVLCCFMLCYVVLCFRGAQTVVGHTSFVFSMLLFVVLCRFMLSYVVVCCHMLSCVVLCSQTIVGYTWCVLHGVVLCCLALS